MVGVSDGPRARVFISYRRADGRYSVGWIQERLGNLQHPDVLAAARTAFSDRDLEPGADFHQRLEEEVEWCAVLIVVIGPNWLGDLGGGHLRIKDPEDWVRREVAIALAPRDDESRGHEIERLVIPVLVDGAEIPEPGDLPEDLRRLTRLNAVSFDDPAGLDDVVKKVRDHLVTVDRHHADDAKLLSAITPPPLEHRARIAIAAATAGLIGAILGWLFVRLGATAELQADFESRFDVSADYLLRVSTIQNALWSALCVLGVAVYRALLGSQTKLHWRSVAMTGVISMIVIAWAIVALGIASPLPGEGFRTWLQATAAIALLSPWIVMLVGPGWMAPRSELLGDEVRVVASQRRAMSVSIGVCVVAIVPTIITTGVLTSDGDNRATLVAFGMFLSLLLLGALEYSHRHLEDKSRVLRDRLESYPPKFEINARPVLIERRGDLWAPLALWATVPTFVALLTGLVLL